MRCHLFCFILRWFDVTSQTPSRPILKMLRDARHDDKDEEREKKMTTGLLVFTFQASSHFFTRPLRPEFADFLNQMLVLDPQHRLSAGDALKHAFLNDS